MHSASATAHTAVVGAGRPDDRVAAGQRRREQLGGHRVRPVPGRDDPDRAARAAHQHHALARRERVRQLAAEALGVLGRHPPVLDQLVDLVVGLRAQRLALVERQRAREVVAAALDLVADRVHLAPRARRRSAATSPRTRGSRRRSPAGRPSGRPAGPADRLAGGRARGLDRLAGGGLPPLAVHEHASRHVGSRVHRLAARLARASSLTMSAHFSPIIIVVMHGLMAGRNGMIDPSAIRSPSTPFTRSRGSTHRVGVAGRAHPRRAGRVVDGVVGLVDVVDQLVVGRRVRARAPARAWPSPRSAACLPISRASLTPWSITRSSLPSGSVK